LSAGRRQIADNSRPEVDLDSEEKRKEVEEGESKKAKVKNTATAAQQEKPKDLKAWAAEKGIIPHAGESSEAFSKRATNAYVQSQVKP
jgi:hypothetical protein